MWPTKTSKSWVLRQAPYLYEHMASYPSLMMFSNYWPYVTNDTQKRDKTCLTIYFLTIALTVCYICSLKNPNQTLFTFSNHEGSLHIYIIHCILYSWPVYAIFKKRILFWSNNKSKLIDRVVSIFFPLILGVP